jgi:hypothetical protein
MQWVNMKTKQWGMPNLVCNAKEKPMKPNKKTKWPSKRKTMHLSLGPCKILSMCDVNQKPCQRWYEIRNSYANLKWAKNNNMKIIGTYATNKNKWQFKKYIVTMIGPTNAQQFK